MRMGQEERARHGAGASLHYVRSARLSVDRRSEAQRSSFPQILAIRQVLHVTVIDIGKQGDPAGHP